ncbi:unnamed protein product [Polarella glacialis]|uniref:Uncharacterized protein n=1 Tax=Polarella glacialis TaxID=89957 RepID=A0A813HVY5_POLGL|nr:unnamed protein product [Polarella glacialis]
MALRRPASADPGRRRSGSYCSPAPGPSGLAAALLAAAAARGPSPLRRSSSPPGPVLPTAPRLLLRDALLTPRVPPVVSTPKTGGATHRAPTPASLAPGALLEQLQGVSLVRCWTHGAHLAMEDMNEGDRVDVLAVLVHCLPRDWLRPLLALL